MRRFGGAWRIEALAEDGTPFMGYGRFGWMIEAVWTAWRLSRLPYAERVEALGVGR